MILRSCSVQDCVAIGHMSYHIESLLGALRSRTPRLAIFFFIAAVALSRLHHAVRWFKKRRGLVAPPAQGPPSTLMLWAAEP